MATIATVPNSSLSSTPADITFTPGTAITLSANTDYWIVRVGAATGNGSYAAWQVAGSDSGSEVGLDHAFWTGSLWTSRPNGTYSAEIPQMEVDASSTPEPSTVTMVGLALGGLALLSRVRRRA